MSTSPRVAPPDRQSRHPAMVSVAALLVWVALADSAVAVRPSAIGLFPDRHVIIVGLGAAAGEAPFARPSLKGELRGALRGALLARFAGRRSPARGQWPAARTATTPRPSRRTDVAALDARSTNNRRRSNMRRIPTIIGAGVVAAATAAAIAVTGSAQAPREQTLTFVERTVPGADVYADVPPLTKSGAGTGDAYLFRNDVLDGGGAKLVIHEGRCSYLRATRGVIGSRLIYDGVYTLRDGTIASSAVLTYGKKPTVAFVVTGGKGAYEGARGSGTLRTELPPIRLADTTIHLLP